MKHFSIMDWADFARHVAPEEQTLQMQRHLDDGCDDCSETEQTWKSVMECARQEASYEPPSGSLRLAKSYFAPFKLAAKLASPIQIARLGFDSFTSRIALGVRGGDSSPRQLMYQHEDMFIDLRLEPNDGSKELLLVGQMVDAGQSPDRNEEIPVTLLSGGDTVLQTVANESGEFRFSFPPAECLQLLLGFRETAVLLSLPEAEA